MDDPLLWHTQRLFHLLQRGNQLATIGENRTQETLSDTHSCASRLDWITNYTPQSLGVDPNLVLPC